VQDVSIEDWFANAKFCSVLPYFTEIQINKLKESLWLCGMSYPLLTLRLLGSNRSTGYILVKPFSRPSPKASTVRAQKVSRITKIVPLNQAKIHDADTSAELKLYSSSTKQSDK
jgi:hypothetical protein